MCLLLNFSHSIFTLLYKQFRVSWLVVFDRLCARTNTNNNDQQYSRLAAATFYVMLCKERITSGTLLVWYLTRPPPPPLLLLPLCVTHMHARIQLIWLSTENSHNLFCAQFSPYHYWLKLAQTTSYTKCFFKRFIPIQICSIAKYFVAVVRVTIWCWWHHIIIEEKKCIKLWMQKSIQQIYH